MASTKTLSLSLQPHLASSETKGVPDMCSTPPARMISAISALIMAAPLKTASMPHMQTRLMVTAVTDSGTPASSAATRVIFSVSTGSMQHPKRTSSIRAGSIPARSIAPFMAVFPMFHPPTSFRVPPKVPMAVLHAETITTSFMKSPFIHILLSLTELFAGYT